MEQAPQASHQKVKELQLRVCVTHLRIDVPLYCVERSQIQHRLSILSRCSMPRSDRASLLTKRYNLLTASLVRKTSTTTEQS